MQLTKRANILAHVVAYLVITYGMSIIGDSLLRQFHLRGHDFGDLFVAVPLVVGLSLIYLGTLLLRRKQTAWVLATALFVFVIGLNVAHLATPHTAEIHYGARLIRLAVPLVILLGLVLSRSMFRVQSDVRSFTQAVRASLVVLLVTLVYGVGGFMLIDNRDFHQEISFAGAMHHTIDQFGLTTDNLIPHTKRAKLFTDSLSVISIVTGAYVAISLFQPLRIRFADQSSARKRAEELLERYGGDIDDFFKLWPHDKVYYFDASDRAGLAYHVTRGVALVVGDPFGDSKRFNILLASFLELCYVNDWLPAFIHVTDKYKALYKQFDFRMQKIGEEAVLDLESFQTEVNNKYFRQIRNRFTKLDYSIEVLQPPHSSAVLDQLRTISNQWLELPGRSERGFMMGSHNDDYMQRGPVVVACDAEHKIQGFINLVPTFDKVSSNYDLLRCSAQAPGNCNDFLLLGLIEQLHAADVKRLNLGLCPLAGLDDKDEEATIVNNALRFLYANGDRFYSFSGLRRFKAKYEPVWEDRSIAYRGGIRAFTRTVAALNRAMKVK
ncbi:MAG: phosphatidylglycerol lysyltransferase domain-containing protein [Candidatus Saccharimonadales bacterium]